METDRMQSPGTHSDIGPAIRFLANDDGTIFTEVAVNYTSSSVVLVRARSGSTGLLSSLSMPLRARPPAAGVQMRVLLDNSIVEIFELVGGTVLTANVFPAVMAGANHVGIVGGDHNSHVSLAVYQMMHAMPMNSTSR